MQKIFTKNRLSITLMLALPLASLMTGCGGGGGGGGGGGNNPPVAAAFAGSYKGVAFYTAGPDAGDARFFDLRVNANGSLASADGAFNTAVGSVVGSGRVSFSQRERDSTTTTGNGQLTPEGIGTLIVSNTGGVSSLAAIARLTGITNSFAGNYFGTTRVRTGTGIGTVEAVAIHVASGGAATVILTNANGTSRQATGTANLTTGALTATSPAGAGAVTLTLQLSRTGQAGGIFETANSRGTVALNKV